jgi:hypothetical protein
VVSGTKNTNTWRIATMAKSAMASPAHVERETFVLTDGWLEANGNCAARLFVSMDLHWDAAKQQFGFGKIIPHPPLSLSKGRGDRPVGRRCGCPTTCDGALVASPKYRYVACCQLALSGSPRPFQGRGGGMILKSAGNRC